MLLFSWAVKSDPLQPHELQHTRSHCPSLCPRLCSNTCPLGHWCQSAISSFVTPYFSCPQSFPKSKLFTSRGQSIGVAASASIIPMNTQDWFPLGFTDLICLQYKGLSRCFSNITVQRLQFFYDQPSLWSNCCISCITTGQTTALTIWTFVA